MFNVRKRLGASILLSLLSIVSICLLLPSSKVKQLQIVTLGTSIEYSDLWKWGGSDLVENEEEDNGNGIRLVILGDSWVDDWVEEGQDGTGNNWPHVLCDEVRSILLEEYYPYYLVLCTIANLLTQINCTSRLNFAASQPSDAWPASPPTGAMTSNAIHEWAVSQDQLLRSEEHNYTAYPDLASQIQTFISLPPPKVQPQETIFIVSFGFWDIYDFAQLDYAAAQNVTDTSIDFMFDQLDVLYAHFATTLYPVSTNPPEEFLNTNATNHTTARHNFKVIIPRIFDPTLSPGWISQRPTPAKPSSIAEQQKNAIYLVQRWNLGVENKMGSWMERNVAISAAQEESTPFSKTKETPSRTDVRETAEGKTLDGHATRSGTPAEPKQTDASNEAKNQKEAKKQEAEQLPKKDIFYHDSASLILDLVLEGQLEDEGVSDAAGLGKGESPFDTVSTPCLRSLDMDDNITTLVEEGWRERNGMLVCKESEVFMWWDAWNLGSKGKKMVGQSISELLKEGNSLRAKMENKGKTS